jgi:hypothetical protein
VAADYPAAVLWLRRAAGAYEYNRPLFGLNTVSDLVSKSGIEEMVSNPVRPISTVNFENSTDLLAERPTGSPSLGK